MVDYVICSNCGKKVSNSTDVEMTVRAYVQCPECIEKEKDHVQEAREQGKREGYEEATKRAIEMAVFNIPYISKFQNTPARLLGVVIPEQ